MVASQTQEWLTESSTLNEREVSRSEGTTRAAATAASPINASAQ